MQVKGYNMGMTVTTRRIIAVVVAITMLVMVVLIVRACQKPASAPLHIGSGQSTVLTDIKWSVISVLKTRSVGPDDGRIYAKNWFLVVDLYLTNARKEKVELEPTAFTLTDGGKNSYQIDRKATDAQVAGLANPKLLSIFAANVLPKAKQRVVMVFAIPETADKLVLNVDGLSIGADRDLIIDLGF